MDKYKIAHQAYAPFGQGRANEMFERAEIKKIASSYGKTTRQIALRFLIQDEVAVIPKTVHTERMQENLNVFDFELTNEEMETLRALDEDKPLIGSAQDPVKAEFAMTW